MGGKQHPSKAVMEMNNEDSFRKAAFGYNYLKENIPILNTAYVVFFFYCPRVCMHFSLAYKFQLALL